MKIVSLEVESCPQCPFFRKFGRFAAPGCGHFWHRMEAFGVKELPSVSGKDPYNGSPVASFSGEIPEWCPLDDALAPL